MLSVLLSPAFILFVIVLILAALLTGMVGARMVTQPAEPQSPAES